MGYKYPIRGTFYGCDKAEIVTPDELMDAIIKARTHNIEKIGGEVIIEGEELNAGEEAEIKEES